MRDRDFADFYSSSFPRVSSAVRAFCGDADVAHEATQEAFARCFARWRRLKGESWVDGWVTTTAMNLSRRHFKRRSAPAQPSTDTVADPTPDRLDLLAALRSLPERQREAVVLFHLLDMPIAEVARSMKLTEGAVKAHLHKARNTLRGSMELSRG